MLAEPLAQRRAALGELLAEAAEPGLTFAEGVVGPGKAFCRDVIARGHEGVMAKRLTSRYLPGRRSPAWQKIKPAQELPCVVIGYRAGQHGLACLLVATVREGKLRYVGRLMNGISVELADELPQRLAPLRRSRPVVPCPHRALWVEPQLYCRVKFMRWTAQGRLRDPVFRGLLEDDAHSASAIA